MSTVAVLDSTCLIGLERVGRLDLLPHLFEKIMAPPAVAAEFGSCPAWLEIIGPIAPGTVAALSMIVDPGEAEAIALAHEKGCRIILDDRKARLVAIRLGIPVTGTIGLLIRAKRSGLIPLIRPLLDSLRQHGFHTSVALADEALRLAGE